MSSLKGRVKRLAATRRADDPERLEITICGGLPPDPVDPDPKIARVVGEQGQTFHREPGEIYTAFQDRVRMTASGAIAICWGGLPPIDIEDKRATRVPEFVPMTEIKICRSVGTE